MNIDYIDIKHVNNTNMYTVSAGKFENNKKYNLVKFVFKIDKNDVKNLEKFAEDLENMKSTKLKISDDSYISYNFNSNIVSFCSDNFMISLINNFAPECTVENLSDMAITLYK